MSKKILILLIVVLLLTVGCGNKNVDTKSNSKNGTLTCTKIETDDDGYKTEEVLKTTYKNNIVKTSNSVSTIEVDPVYLDFTFQIMQGLATNLNEVDGVKVNVKKESSKIVTTTNIELDKVDVAKIKEVYGELADDDALDAYNKKDVNINKYKAELIDEGYTCN